MSSTVSDLTGQRSEGEREAQDMAISIERIRELLGPEAEGKSDEQLEALRDRLQFAVGRYYDAIQEAWKRDPDAVRWLVHAHQTGEYE